MVAVLPIVPMMRTSKPGKQRCDRNAVIANAHQADLVHMK